MIFCYFFDAYGEPTTTEIAEEISCGVFTCFSSILPKKAGGVVIPLPREG